MPKPPSPIIGYTLGPQYPRGGELVVGQPTPVTVLPCREFKDHISTTEAEVESLKQAYEDAKTRLRLLVESCPHPVFNDHDAYPYYDRRCLICGRSIDTI